MTLNLTDSLISIQQQQLTSKRSVPTQVNFNFTESSLKAISDRRQNFKRLQLSSELLAELRYYSLLQNSAANSLTFITYYVQQQQKIAVIKTVISLQGKISQQLCRSFLNNPQLLKDLVINHYWLIENVCDRLYLKYTNKSFLLTIFLSFIISLIIAPLIIYFITFGLPIKLIMLLIIFLLLYCTIRFILKKYLTSFIWQQLLFGDLSKNTARRRLGFVFLRYFG
jgi:hypothetical protein